MDKKEFEKSYAKAQEQHEVQRSKVKADIEELTEEQKRIIQFRIQRGDIDFSLFNYIMTIHDFTKFEDLNEVLFAFYKYMYTHVYEIQKSNEVMKDVLHQNLDSLSRTHKKLVKEELTKKGPFQMAHDFGEEIQRRAKDRSKLGIQSYSPEEAQKMGLKL